jgi:hypothetical protein
MAKGMANIAGSKRGSDFAFVVGNARRDCLVRRECPFTASRAPSSVFPIGSANSEIAFRFGLGVDCRNGIACKRHLV